MRVVRKMVVVGLAVIGAIRVWELLAPMVDETRRKLSGARDEIEPRLKETARAVEKTVQETVQEPRDLTDGRSGVEKPEPIHAAAGGPRSVE